MTWGPDVEADSPDAFSAAAECRARKPSPVIIGVTPHTHVCREIVDEEADHSGPHQCTCGATW